MATKWSVVLSKEETGFLGEAGIIYRDAKNFQAARDVFSGLKALFPRNEVPEILLGTVEFHSGNVDSAIDHYRKAIELNPRSAFAHAHLGEAYLFGSKDKEQARSQLKTAVTLDPLGEYGKMARAFLEMVDQATFS